MQHRIKNLKKLSIFKKTYRLHLNISLKSAIVRFAQEQQVLPQLCASHDRRLRRPDRHICDAHGRYRHQGHIHAGKPVSVPLPSKGILRKTRSKLVCKLANSGKVLVSCRVVMVTPYVQSFRSVVLNLFLYHASLK